MPEQKALENFERNFNTGMICPINFVLEAVPLGPAPQVPSTPGLSTNDQASMVQVSIRADQMRPGLRNATFNVDEMRELHRQRQDLSHPNTWADLAKLAIEGNESNFDCVAPPQPTGVLAGTEEDEAEGSDYAVALSDGFGRRVCDFARDVISVTNGTDWQINVEDMVSIWWLPINKLSDFQPQVARVTQAVPPGHHPGEQLIKTLRPLGKNPLAKLPPILLEKVPSPLRRSMSVDGNKITFKVMTSYRPSGEASKRMDDEIRKSLVGKRGTFVSQGQLYEFRVTYTSPMQLLVDAGHELRSAVPKAVAVFLSLVGVAVAVCFCSAFLALKLALTVIIPILTTYGMAVAIYQLHLLDFVGLKIVEGTHGGMDFRMIILTAGLLFGFAMDYDLFLFIRVFEYRKQGYDNLSAVRRALAETGPVITTAGTLMAISFFCVWASQTVLLRVMGFIFFMGVVFDVFVIRMMIAPVFLSIGETLNYWPGKMPTPTKKWP